jgi:FkbM family methyltransferase
MAGTRTLTTSLGHSMTVFTDDLVGNKIARHGLYEKENLQLFLALLSRLRDPVVLDVGANIGNHTLAFATRAAQVHSFEPIPHIYALLMQNVTRNLLTNVQLHPLALSDRTGSDTIHMVKVGNLGASSFDRRGEDTEPVTVQKVTGDDYLAEHGVTRVDFVKIDVEAHEVFVLRGLLRTLSRDLPIITLEWNDPLTIQRLFDSPELAFLQTHYHIHVLTSDHERLARDVAHSQWLRRQWYKLFRSRRVRLRLSIPHRCTRICC